VQYVINVPHAALDGLCVGDVALDEIDLVEEVFDV